MQGKQRKEELTCIKEAVVARVVAVEILQGDFSCSKQRKVCFFLKDIALLLEKSVFHHFFVLFFFND